MRAALVLATALLAAAVTPAQAADATPTRSAGFTLEQAACQGALPRERFESWLRTNPVAAWAPASMQRDARTDRNARQELLALTNFVKHDGELFTFTTSSSTDPAQITWIDFSGDGRCDVIATWYDASGMNDYALVFLFRQVGDGFKLELNSTMAFDVSSYGERPAPLLPVRDLATGAVYLFAQQPLRFAASETPSELFNGSDSMREALRWNPQQSRFDLLSMNPKAVPANAALVEAMWQYVQRQPAAARGQCVRERNCNPPL